jgi:hypothetical protein
LDGKKKKKSEKYEKFKKLKVGFNKMKLDDYWWCSYEIFLNIFLITQK